VRRLIGGIGRSFVTVGILILLFVTYQLWGTGLYTSRQQDLLREQFNTALQRENRTAPSTTTTSVVEPTVTTTTAPPIPLAPIVKEGDAIAQIRIPRIGIDRIVVEGVELPDLRKGPGHYPETPLPGQEGNAAIAGHRTTYSHPFGDLDQLEKGDRIFIRTAQGNFTYKVYESLIVKPTDVQVLDPDRFRPATLTLTTCNPKYSASQRLVVKGVLQEDPLPALESTGNPKLTKAGLSGEESDKLPTLGAGLVTAAIGLLWLLIFHRHPSWVNWLIGAIPFAVSLFVFYALLERVLPSNY
jgi:sortase A